MIELITKPIKRFFAFGCSFTQYHWTTWPEIVAEDLNINDFYNLGKSGAGNEFIFNRLMQADQIFNLNEEDLVIICWTNSAREDKFVGDWITPGNIYTQNEYSLDFVKKYYAKPELSLLHDFAFIKASRILLQHKKVQWHFLQMISVFDYHDQWKNIPVENKTLNHLIAFEKKFFNPSFYEILWNNSVKNKFNKENLLGNQIKNDGHPSPLEHFEYLKKIFDHNWQLSTTEKIHQLEDEYVKKFIRQDYKNNHLRYPLDCAIF